MKKKKQQYTKIITKLKKYTRKKGDAFAHIGSKLNSYKRERRNYSLTCDLIRGLETGVLGFKPRCSAAQNRFVKRAVSVRAPQSTMTIYLSHHSCCFFFTTFFSSVMHICIYYLVLTTGIKNKMIPQKKWVNSILGFSFFFLLLLLLLLLSSFCFLRLDFPPTIAATHPDLKERKTDRQKQSTWKNLRPHIFISR